MGLGFWSGLQRAGPLTQRTKLDPESSLARPSQSMALSFVSSQLIATQRVGPEQHMLNSDPNQSCRSKRADPKETQVHRAHFWLKIQHWLNLNSPLAGETL